MTEANPTRWASRRPSGITRRRCAEATRSRSFNWPACAAARPRSIMAMVAAVVVAPKRFRSAPDRANQRDARIGVVRLLIICRPGRRSDMKRPRRASTRPLTSTGTLKRPAGGADGTGPVAPPGDDELGWDADDVRGQGRATSASSMRPRDLERRACVSTESAAHTQVGTGTRRPGSRTMASTMSALSRSARARAAAEKGGRSSARAAAGQEQRRNGLWSTNSCIANTVQDGNRVAVLTWPVGDLRDDDVGSLPTPPAFRPDADVHVGDRDVVTVSRRRTSRARAGSASAPVNIGVESGPSTCATAASRSPAPAAGSVTMSESVRLASSRAPDNRRSAGPGPGTPRWRIARPPGTDSGPP